MKIPTHRVFKDILCLRGCWSFRGFTVFSVELHSVTFMYLVYTHLFKFDCVISNITFENHAPIHSWNQPVLSNEGKVSCSSKQLGSLMRFKLTTDRIMSQTLYPVHHVFKIVEMYLLRYREICQGRNHQWQQPNWNYAVCKFCFYIRFYIFTATDKLSSSVCVFTIGT